jgi:hypothetical protein
MDADRLIQLHQSNGLVYYLVRVGCNAVNGNRYTKFYRDFLRTTETLPENYDEEAEDYDETHIRRKQEAVESVNFKEVANHFEDLSGRSYLIFFFVLSNTSSNEGLIRRPFQKWP